MHKEVQWAIITGASGAIGRELSYEIIKKGYHAILVGRDIDKLEALRKDIHSEFEIDSLVLAVDLSNESGCIALKSFVDERMIEPKVLINNAGTGSYGNLSDTEGGEVNAMIDINIRCTTELSRIFSRDFAEQGCGYILNIASFAGVAPMPNMAVYAASKAYILSFSLALREELLESRVSVSVSCPGPVNTKFLLRNGFENALWAQNETNLLSPEKVAKSSIAGLFSGKPVIFPRKRDTYLAYTLRILPRSWSMMILHYATK